MKIRIMLIIGLFVILLCYIYITGGIASSATATFDGSRVINNGGYFLNFKILNREDSYDMELKRGDVLNVSWDIKRGSVDVIITSDSGEEIYVANNRGPIDHTKFQLSINEDSSYTIKVSGKKAKGKMNFSKE